MWTWIIVGIVVLAIFGWLSGVSAKGQALAKYKNALNELKKAPGNADVRQRTLELGRIYANLVRNNKGHSIFDEVMLMNDINAACAATQAVVANAAIPDVSTEARLRKLQSLREQGLLDAAEYVQRRKEILDQV